MFSERVSFSEELRIQYECRVSGVAPDVDDSVANVHVVWKSETPRQ